VSTPAHTFTLLPFAATAGDAVRCITGQISRVGDELRVRYRLQGDADRLRVPAEKPPRFADELWRHTCFELFVAGRGESAYHEMNFSPASEWAAYTFARYRERVAPTAVPDPTRLDPHITVRRASQGIELDATVALAALSPHLARGTLMVGLTAVIETRDGALSYWALRHPAAKPDFHHPDSFALELHEIRN